METEVICACEVLGKPWTKVGFKPETASSQPFSIQTDGLEFGDQFEQAAPTPCADIVISRVFESLSNYNVRFKHFTDIYIVTLIQAKECILASIEAGMDECLKLVEVEIERRKESVKEAEHTATEIRNWIESKNCLEAFRDAVSTPDISTPRKPPKRLSDLEKEDKYRIRKIMEKRGCTEIEARSELSAQKDRERRYAKGASKGNKRKTNEERTIYTVGDVVVSRIIPSGGSPGTGKRR